MNLVNLEGIRKQYSERVLLDGADLRINSGDRIGLIGVNGSGKTTLLRMVAGLERTDEGSVTIWGGVRVTYLPQEPVLDPDHTVLDAIYAGDAPMLALLREHATTGRAIELDPDDEAMQERFHRSVAALDAAGGWAAEADAKAVLGRLGIEDVDARVGTLSGGMQKRVALARALVDPADLLVLDEPTNHLDAETLAWLEKFLLRGEHAILMVTHDRYFLDRIADRIVELDRRTLVSYVGSYKDYLAARSVRHERMAKSEEDRRRHLKRELEWLRKGAKARSTKQKARSQRAAEMLTIQHDSGEERVALALASRRLGKQALTADGLSKAYDDNMVLDGVDLHIGPGERIGIVGPNGAGKSTLLDILTGRLEPDGGVVRWGETVAIGYFDQRSAELQDDMKLIDYIEQEAPLIRTNDGDKVSASRMLEWLLFSRPKQHAYIGSLSGGERRRLYLLRTLIHRPNVIILDEPTNDLDIETLGVLESFLDSFTGTLIVVSHDRYFLDRTVDQLAVLEDGRLLTGYPTPFESFLRVRAEQEAGTKATNLALSVGGSSSNGDADGARGSSTPNGDRASPSPSTNASSTSPAKQTTKRKLSFKEAREYEALGTRIEEQEVRKAALQKDLNAAGADFERIQSIAEELAALDSALDADTERWLELEEQKDGG